MKVAERRIAEILMAMCDEKWKVERAATDLTYYIVPYDIEGNCSLN
jgi:hypothetical protein